MALWHWHWHVPDPACRPPARLPALPLRAAMHFCGIYGLIMISTTITVSVNIQFFGAFTGALMVATAIMMYFYLPAAMALKKVRAVTSGALVGLVAETLEGLNVIQAFSKQDFFIQEACRRTDAANAAVFCAESLNLWLAFFCDFIGALMVLVVSLFAVATVNQCEGDALLAGSTGGG